MAWRHEPILLLDLSSRMSSKYLNDSGLVWRVKAFGDAITCVAHKLVLLV